jgi:uncharacterized protein (DUF58 family)
MSHPAPISRLDGLVSEALEAALPAIVMDARRAAASIVMGEHGKRRSGTGDSFWQHREWTNGESVRQIDWRRSARSDKYFIKEREHQVPALLQIWCDGRPGMAWRSDDSVPTKAQRALVLGLALGIATRAGGERVCAMGSGAPMRDEGQFAQLLVANGASFETKIKAGQVVIISDGLESPEIWAARAKDVASARAELFVVLVRDEAEATFPYQGRISFRRGVGDDPIIVGRAQGAQSDYQSAYKRHMDSVGMAIGAGGGQVLTHSTRAPAVPTLLALATALNRASPRSVVA